MCLLVQEGVLQQDRVVHIVFGLLILTPLKYNLLFERFLNPERVSMPDIDIDFDDEGRGRVLDYVIEKYGTNQVAQIITYGTMAAKSSLEIRLGYWTYL